MKKFTVHPTTSIFADVNADLEQITSTGRWSNEQMRQIRFGLEYGLDVSVYADPKYSWQQMDQILAGLEADLDVSAYADPKYDAGQMRVIRNGLRRRS